MRAELLKCVILRATKRSHFLEIDGPYRHEMFGRHRRDLIRPIVGVRHDAHGSQSARSANHFQAIPQAFQADWAAQSSAPKKTLPFFRNP
jgi:hypothetical protein